MSRRYQIVFNEAFDGTIKNDKYAEVIDTEDNQIILEAFYVLNNLQRYGYSIASGHKGDKCVVTFDHRYLGYFQKESFIFEPLIMHELGHYLNGDSRRKPDRKKERLERIAVAESGGVSRRESDADDFAVSQVGKKALRRALEYVKKDAIRLGATKDNPGIIEMEKRIKRLK